MAGSVNKVIVLGNLGANPEIKYLPSGQAVCEMRIATTERFKDKQDQLQERTEWHRIVVWGKTAENCAKYLSKNRQAYVEKRLQTRSWDDKEGNKRYSTEIVADQVVFLGGGAGAGAGGAGGAGAGGYGSGGPTEDAPRSGQGGGGYGGGGSGAGGSGAGGGYGGGGRGSYGGGGGAGGGGGRGPRPVQDEVPPEDFGGGGDDDIPF